MLCIIWGNLLADLVLKPYSFTQADLFTCVRLTLTGVILSSQQTKGPLRKKINAMDYAVDSYEEQPLWWLIIFMISTGLNR